MKNVTVEPLENDPPKELKQDSDTPLSPSEGFLLLLSTYAHIMVRTGQQIIRQAVTEKSKEINFNINDYPQPLHVVGGSFITLTIDKNLRGCIGTIRAHRPLILDIAQNSYAAAFRDHRFRPVQASELKTMQMSLSLLTPTEDMSFSSQEDLESQLRPGIDGVIISDGDKGATYLPEVWEGFSDARSFLSSLKKKAGMAEDYWSENFAAKTYQTHKTTPLPF